LLKQVSLTYMMIDTKPSRVTKMTGILCRMARLNLGQQFIDYMKDGDLEFPYCICR